MFGVCGDVCVGYVYINRKGGSHSGGDSTIMYDNLLEDIATAHQTFEHLTVIGDFNAHLGRADELAYEHSEILARFGSLCTTRRAEGIRDPVQYKIAGRLITDVASTCPLLLTTGRGRGQGRTVGSEIFVGEPQSGF